MKKLPIQIKIVVIIIVILLITKTISPLVTIYNSTTELRLSYNKEVQTQLTNYDGYYLAFIDKQDNATVNKETFLQVTNIIMLARKDGENLAWKWNTENQNIPYSEFSDFYRELSNFISIRYQDNMVIERNKQDIVQKHNTILVTFPGNIYNKLLGVKQLKYKFGYVSKKTMNRFK